MEKSKEYTAQKLKFSIKNFCSKCDQIHRKLRIWSHLLKKSLMENFMFVECHVPVIRVVQKMKFSIKDSSGFPANLVTFNEEILNEKFYFLCSDSCWNFHWINVFNILKFATEKCNISRLKLKNFMCHKAFWIP